MSGGKWAVSAKLGAKERVRLLRDGALNNLSLLLSGLIGIVLVPIMLKGLGAESYGVWIAAFSVMGTAGLIDFGLALGVTREAATALGSDSWNEAAPFIRAAGTVFWRDCRRAS